MGFSSDFTNPGFTLAATDKIPRYRESSIRALAAVGTTRTWNLMFDVIAQSGRKTSAGTNFTVDGEVRYWVHLAIDRFTGKVLEKQVELVKE